MLKWPDAKSVDAALRAWAQEIGAREPEILKIGYFGSYARGDWGVGSDVDLVVIIERSAEPFERRAVRWDTSRLPVPADVLVYTASEWESLLGQGGFIPGIAKEAVWVYAGPNLIQSSQSGSSQSHSRH